MGSLVAGWDAPIMDENKARMQRNKSLTIDEINAFWRSRSQRTDTDRDMNLSPYGSPINSPEFLNETDRRRAAAPFSRSQTDAWSILHSHSVPDSPRSTSGEEMASTSDKTGAWWTRSSSAFLNEPPRDEMFGMAAHKYTVQFNVGRLATDNA